MLPPGPTVQRAFDLLQARRYDQAEQILRRHLMKEAKDATGFHILAATLLSKGQHAQAVFFARQANALCPHDYAILNILGTAMTAAGETEAAALSHRYVLGFDVSRTALDERRDGVEINLATGVATPVLLGERMPVRDFPNSTLQEFGVYAQDEIGLGERIAGHVVLSKGERSELAELAANLL